MPVVSVAGRGVIETGSFVLPHRRPEAMLSVQGMNMGLKADPSLALGQVAGTSTPQGDVLSFAPFSGGNNLHVDGEITANGLSYKIDFVITVVDGNGNRDYSVTYTVMK